MKTTKLTTLSFILISSLLALSSGAQNNRNSGTNALSSESDIIPNDPARTWSNTRLAH